MAGATSVLDKTYKNEVAAGITKYSALVHGTGAGGAQLPAAANAANLVGVAQEEVEAPSGGSAVGRGVSVRKLGITRVIAAQAISVGDFVNVADAQGRVKPLNEVAGTLVHVLGMAETVATAAGDIVQVFLSIHDSTT